MAHKAYDKWKVKVKPLERLGQAFCNNFIKSPWPELFYEENETKAEVMIKEWLTNNHYYATMPPKLKASK